MSGMDRGNSLPFDPSKLGRVGNFFQSMTERDPQKRRVKVNENFASDFVLSGLGVQSSSSDDEDFVPDAIDDPDASKSRKRKRLSAKERKRDKGRVPSKKETDSKDAEISQSDNSKDQESNASEGGESDGSSGDNSSSRASSDSDGSDESDNDEEEESENDLDSAAISQEEEEPEMENLDTVTENDTESPKAPPIKICSVCLSDKSFDEDEIVECDSCGISVHEGCYGITNEDTDSVHSTVSSSSTEPWFCDACKANIPRPVCALCPNTDGIFKESDCGRWVHVVCALYIRGVSFTDPSCLKGLTLYELDNDLFGYKPCVLCDDVRLSYTGVCISCDAGMCKVHFHATCAQKFGLLVDASHTLTSQEIDPFYAYCKHHSDKFIMKHRKKNYLSLLNHYKRMEKIRSSNMETISMNLVVATTRTEKKLTRARMRYAQAQELIRLEAWLPTERSQNLLTRSSSAMKRLIKKGKLQGDCLGVGLPNPDPVPEAFKVDMNAIKKKQHMQPMFSNEFLCYYFNRNSRIFSMRREQRELVAQNVELKKQQSNIRQEHQGKADQLSFLKGYNTSFKDSLTRLHSYVSDLGNRAGLKIPPIPTLTSHVKSEGLKSPSRSKSNSLKHSQIKNKTSHNGHSGSVRSRILHGKNRQLTSGDTPSPIGQECDICHKRDNFHKLAHCDKCLKFKHITCLNPPLRAVPKKTRFGGWMCSECHEGEITDAEDMDSIPSSPALEEAMPNSPLTRKSTLRGKVHGPVKYEPEVKNRIPRPRGRPKKSGSRRGRGIGVSSSLLKNPISKAKLARAKSLRMKAALSHAKKVHGDISVTYDQMKTELIDAPPLSKNDETTYADVTVKCENGSPLPPPPPLTSSSNATVVGSPSKIGESLLSSPSSTVPSSILANNMNGSNCIHKSPLKSPLSTFQRQSPTISKDSQHTNSQDPSI